MSSDRVILKAWNASLAREENVRSSYNSIKSIEVLHERIHAGRAFIHAHAHNNIAAGGVISHLIVPNSGADIHLNELDFNTSLGPMTISLYEAPFVNANSLGTDITSTFKNANRRSSNVFPATVWDSPFTNVDSLGERLDYDFVESAAGGPIKTAGGGAGNLVEFVLDDQIQYLLYVRNESANVASFTSMRAVAYDGRHD